MENHSPSLFLKAFIVAGASLVLGLCFDYFFFDKGVGINFPLYIGLVVLGLFVLAEIFKRPLDKKTYGLFIPLAFFSVMVFVRASLLLTFLNIGASFLILLLIAHISFAKNLRSLVLLEYAKVFLTPFKFIVPFFTTIGDLVALRGLNKDQKVASQIFKGVIITAPILLVFILLFSSADLVFHKYLVDFISIDISEKTLARTILVLLTTSVFIGAYSYLFKKPEHVETGHDQQVASAKIGNIEASILLVSVNILFLIFIILQLAYLFGGQSTVSDQGFTYASYAQRGFFELIAVAVISFFMLLLAEKHIAKKDGSHSMLFKGLSSALIVQVIVIMCSAFMRLSLYEAAYGFTTLRLYSHAFIVFLGVIFCLLANKILKDARENALAFRIFIAVVSFTALMNLLNPDAFIARHNLDRYRETGKLDGPYMATLSTDAVPVSIEILSMPKDQEARYAAYILYEHGAWMLNESNPQNWQSTSISRMRAKKIFTQNLSLLEQYKMYVPNYDAAYGTMTITN